MFFALYILFWTSIEKEKNTEVVFKTKNMSRIILYFTKRPFQYDVSMISPFWDPPPTCVIMSAWNEEFQTTHPPAINKTKKNESIIETNCKKHIYGSTSSFVIKKSVSRHHTPTCQYCQHEIRFFRPPTLQTVRRHIEMVPRTKRIFITAFMVFVIQAKWMTCNCVVYLFLRKF